MNVKGRVVGWLRLSMLLLCYWSLKIVYFLHSFSKLSETRLREKLNAEIPEHNYLMDPFPLPSMQESIFDLYLQTKLWSPKVLLTDVREQEYNSKFQLSNFLVNYFFFTFDVIVVF